MAQYAASLADLVLVNINPAYKPEELQFTINNVGVEALITLGDRNETYMQTLSAIVPDIDTSSPGKLASD